MKVNEDGSVIFDSWPLGQDNVAADYELDPEALRFAVNADITNKGKLVRSAGYSKILSGYNVHSLWGIKDFPFGFVVDNGVLYRLDESLSKTALLSVDAISRMSYRFLNDRVYFSNQHQSGYVDRNGFYTPWLVETPQVAPQVSVWSTGGLDAGKYQVSCQFRRNDNWLSGSPSASIIDIPAGGGIDLSNISQPYTPEINAIRLYVTHANGDQLYHYVDLPVGVTTYRIEKRELGRVLDTQGLKPFPLGKHIAFYRGRWYTAMSSVLFFSESLNFALTRFKKNFFVFPAPITLVEPVDDGIFIGTTKKHYFLSGEDALSMSLREVLQTGAVEWSAVTPEAMAGEMNSPVWIAQEIGFVEGSAGGQVKLITKQRLALPTAEQAASFYRKRPGVDQIVTSMSGSGNVAHGAASDSVEVEIIRNGILLQ